MQCCSLANMEHSMSQIERMPSKCGELTSERIRNEKKIRIREFDYDTVTLLLIDMIR